MGKKKMDVVITKRLIIKPLTNEQLKEKIESFEDEGLKAAFSEMLDGCIAHETQRLWYTNWEITDKKTAEVYGSLCFKGREAQTETEIGYGIDEPFRGKGYATEAVKAMLTWAFNNDEKLYFITAETGADNEPSKHVLKRCGFKEAGQGIEGPRFEFEKTLPYWMSIFMCLGLSVGMLMGITLFDNSATGMCIGMCLGVALGASLDANEKKKRLELRQNSNPENCDYDKDEPIDPAEIQLKNEPRDKKTK